MDWIRTEIEAAGFEFAECVPVSPDETAEIAADADVVWDLGGVTMITAEILPRLERCGAIIRGGSGTDNIPVARATELGIIVANTPDGTERPVAEHTIGFMLSATRHITAKDRAVRAGVWSMDDPMPLLLSGRTIGLIGFGRIGRGVAARLQPFGVTIMAFDPIFDAAKMAALDVQAATFSEILTASDIISVHTPLTEATHHLIGADELKQMKANCILVNTSRGPVVDTQALAAALRDGTIAGAAVDVLEEEPPADDNPLIGLPNVIITAHCAGYHADTLDDFSRLAIETIHDLAARKWPRSHVNPQVVPRWDMNPRM
jgi:D-3-phosphoglycerate dehydrogenase